jgi:hypothetical protein
MTNKPDFVDESRLIGADCTFVNLLTVVVINHVLLEMSFVSKHFSAERAGDLVHDVSVAEVILENAF